MLRALWFFIQAGLVIAAALWLLERPGDIMLRWDSYTITMQAGFFALAGVLTILALVQFIRLLGFVFSIPGFMSARRREKNRQKGMMALTRGLAAISAGDVKTAARLSKRAEKFLPAQALPLLLSAQSASLEGNKARAIGLYEQLLEDKDGAFFGLRGLIQSALARGDKEEALKHARAALGKHPRVGWVLNLVYTLELACRKWEEAQKTLERIERFKARDEKLILSDRIAFHLLKAKGEDEKLLKKAYGLDAMSLPAAIALARYYADHKKHKKAVQVIEKIWPASPHPDLLAVWTNLAPDNKPSDMMQRLRWFERLVSLNPDSALGQMAAARAAIEDGLWNEAGAYLSMAETLGPSAELYRLRAELERATSRDEDVAAHWLGLATEAPPSKVWTCAREGTVYKDWVPVAEPHGAFNTIVWDYPGQAMKRLTPPLSMQDSLGFFPRGSEAA